MVSGENGNEVIHPLEMPLFFDRKGKAFYILDSWGGGLQLQAKMLKAQLHTTHCLYHWRCPGIFNLAFRRLRVSHRSCVIFACPTQAPWIPQSISDGMRCLSLGRMVSLWLDVYICCRFLSSHAIYQICIARGSDCVRVLYVSRVGEGTYFCCCWNYQIWEVGGRSQCHTAEMTGRLQKMGRRGRIFIGSGYVNPILAASGARSVFWDSLSFFFFLLLPLFLSLKY